MPGASAFITPCQPTLRKEPPTGLGWVHEVKFDGFRIQVHRDDRKVTIYSRNGHDFTDRYPAIVRDILKIPTKQFIIDAEITAIDNAGMPAFGALLRARLDSPVCIWVFDMLSYRGKDVRALHWVARRYKLDQLLGRSGSPLIRDSETFSDPHSLLFACEKFKLEGIVSKRIDRPYISGRTTTWIKVKCASWRDGNRWRGEFFSKKK